MKTCTQHIKTSKKEMQNSLGKKKEKELVPILYQNATGSDWSRILTSIKCRRVCMKTCTQHIKTSKKEMKNSLKKKKKKTRTNFVPKCHQVRLVKNFDLHQMSACVHENLYIAHEDVLERNAKFLKKKKKNSYQFCTKTPLGQIG